MLLQSALARTPQLRQVLRESDIKYPAFLETMTRQLFATSGDCACKVAPKVLELTTFLAERSTLKVSHAGGQSPKSQGHKETAANASGGGDQPFVSGKEGGGLGMTTNVYHDSYIPLDDAYGEQYGTDIDILQMPDLGDFTFLVNQAFDFDGASQQDYWSSRDAFAIPGWPTQWQT